MTDAQILDSVRSRAAVGFLAVLLAAPLGSCSPSSHPGSRGQSFGEPDFGPPPASESRETYRCYPKSGEGDFEICVPSIGQGKRLLARTATLTAEELGARLRERLHSKAPSATLRALEQGDTPAEKALLASSPGVPVFDASEFFPAFVRQSFNTQASFSGPNCYNAALITAGLIDSKPLRHLSRQEFDLYLSRFFDQVQEPRFGDLVVFDALQSRDHVAFYLFGDLIFHKRGFQQVYGYRVTELTRAFAAEPFESGSSPAQASDPARAPRQYYRMKSAPSPEASADGLDPGELAMKSVADYLAEETARRAATWSVGTVMGTMMDSVFAELLQELKKLEQSPSFAHRLAYARLISAKDQAHAAIGESLYASPFAEPRLINRDHCYFDHDFTRELIRRLMTLIQGRPPAEGEVDRFVHQKLALIDKERCQVPLVRILREWK